MYPTFLPFLRFTNVELQFRSYGLIEKKCENIQLKLHKLKHVLIDSNWIKFNAKIDQNDGTAFNNHLQLLEYIRNQLLPICNSSRGYEFYIAFKSDNNYASNIIESLIQMQAIKRCSKIKIGIVGGDQMYLPVKEISNWLESTNEIENKEEKLLVIELLGAQSIQNAQEIVDCLKTVYFSAFL